MRERALSVSEVEHSRQRGWRVQRAGSGTGLTRSGTARRPLRMERSERKGVAVSAIREVGWPHILWGLLGHDKDCIVFKV